MDVIFLIVAGLITSLACGLGAIPVFFLGDRVEKWQPFLSGLASGLMVAASIEGLLQPALKSGSFTEVSTGLIAGVFLLILLRYMLHGRELEFGNLKGEGVDKSALVFIALFIHSLPEGMAMGAAQASSIHALNIFVIAAIALQNIPEGTAIALPMAESGFSRRAQFGAAVLSSIPQPIGAPLAFLLVGLVEPLLAWSLAFAAGAMLTVVAMELAPKAFGKKTWKSGVLGAFAGSVIMVLLSVMLGVS